MKTTTGNCYIQQKIERFRDDPDVPNAHSVLVHDDDENCKLERPRRRKEYGNKHMFNYTAVDDVDLSSSRFRRWLASISQNGQKLGVIHHQT